MCAARIAAPARRWVWLGALVQFAVVAVILLVFRLPRFLIMFCALFSAVAVLLANVLTRKAASARLKPQRPVPNSVGFRLVTIAILLCGLVLVCFLLFGSVTFINSWNNWQRYGGQPFHRAEFVVEHDYYQAYSKSADLYANGTVEGQREWMDLKPYLYARNLYRPHGAAELEAWVPPGTSIPIYLFPNLKGRSRVRLYADASPAEAYHRAAMKAANYGLGGVAFSALAMFVLTRIRAACFG
jgi:hypothetical protein